MLLHFDSGFCQCKSCNWNYRSEFIFNVCSLTFHIQWNLRQANSCVRGEHRWAQLRERAQARVHDPQPETLATHRLAVPRWVSCLRSLSLALSLLLTLSSSTQRRSLFLQLDNDWAQFLNDCWPSWLPNAERCSKRESSRVESSRRESWVVVVVVVCFECRRRQTTRVSEDVTLCGAPGAYMRTDIHTYIHVCANASETNKNKAQSAVANRRQSEI